MKRFCIIAGVIYRLVKNYWYSKHILLTRSTYPTNIHPDSRTAQRSNVQEIKVTTIGSECRVCVYVCVCVCFICIGLVPQK
jgi:hypothetical protein